MIKINIKNTRTCELTQTEVVRKGENNISYFYIKLPLTVGDENYNIKDCIVEMRCYISSKGYIPYNLDTNNTTVKIPITTDITDEVRSVKIMFIFKHSGEVIGKTNQVLFKVINTPNGDDSLTPRAEFDKEITRKNKIISDQNEEILSAKETISSQSETITQQGEQITELSGEVTELQEEVSEQAQTITRQNTTIDQLNSRVPALEQLDPINPSGIQQTYNPESPNIGFPQVIVNPPTAEGVGFNENYYKEGETCLGKVGTYNPFPYESQGGIFILEMNTQLELPSKILIKDYVTAPNTELRYGDFIFFNGITALEELIVEGSPSIAGIAGYLMYDHGGANIKKIDLSKSFISFVEERGFSFSTGSSLEELYFSDSLTRLENYAIQKATALTRLNLGNSLITIGGANMQNCSALERIELPDTLEIIGNKFCNGCKKLRTINFPKSLQSIDSWYFLAGCTSLEYVTIENGFNCDNLVLSVSTLYSVETIVSWLEALADRTGDTAYTLTIGTTNLNKLTAEQKAIATNKNWNLA